MPTRIEQISGVALEFGKGLLSQSQALYPYATVLLPNGEQSMMSLNFEFSTPAEAEERLIAGLSEDAADGAIVAAGWGYTVDVTSDQGTFPALKILAEAMGEAPHTLYVPYVLQEGGSTKFGEPVPGPAREAVIFRGAEQKASTAAKKQAARKQRSAKAKPRKKPAAKRAAAPKRTSKRKAAPKSSARKARKGKGRR